MHGHHTHGFFRTGGLVAAIGLGLAFPQLYHFRFLIPFLLMVMLFFVFLRVSAPLHALRPSHLWLLLWNIGLAPAVYGAVTALGGSHELALAAFLAAITPTGTAAPVVMGFLNGRVEYVILSFLVTTLTFTFVIPVLFPIFLGSPTPGIMVLIFKSVSSVIFIPMVLAAVIRWRVPSAREWYHKTQTFSFLLWAATLCLMTANASRFMHDRSAASAGFLGAVLGVTFVICALNFGVGFLLGGKDFRHECSQSLGQKNTSLTFFVGVTFASPAVALGPCLYILWHNLWNAIQLAMARDEE